MQWIFGGMIAASIALLGVGQLVPIPAVDQWANFTAVAMMGFCLLTVLCGLLPWVIREVLKSSRESRDLMRELRAQMASSDQSRHEDALASVEAQRQITQGCADRQTAWQRTIDYADIVHEANVVREAGIVAKATLVRETLARQVHDDAERAHVDADRRHTNDNPQASGLNQ